MKHSLLKFSWNIHSWVKRSILRSPVAISFSMKFRFKTFRKSESCFTLRYQSVSWLTRFFIDSLYIIDTHISRKYTIVYTIMAISSYTSYHIKVIINLIKKGTLPYNMWLPYNLLDSPLVFYITAVQQIIILFFATIINIGTETLVSGLFLHTCVQLEIFELRIHKFVINKTAKLAEEYREYCLDSASHKKAIISEHICHHLLIYKLVVYVAYTFTY